MTARPLTSKQQAFAIAYVGPAKGVGVQAARMAGYTGSDAALDVQARRCLGDARVMLLVEQYRAKVVQEGVLTAQEVAVRLSAIGMGMVKESRLVTGKAGDFIEAEVTMPGTVQVCALRALNAQMGYEAPTKNEHSGTVGLELTLTPEQDAALAEYLEMRDDPIIKARMAELRGEG